jgi:hypothetical protein
MKFINDYEKKKDALFERQDRHLFRKKQFVIPLVLIIIILSLVGLFAFEVDVEWSIGVYSSDNILSMQPYTNNPVITGRNANADSVADPFIIRGKKWYMFFEEIHDRKGDIGVAVSEDAYNWNYAGKVLEEPFHLSYPYIFVVDDEYYMIPESREAKGVRLYKSIEFPMKWIYICELIKGAYLDPSIIKYGDNFWLFVSDDTHNLYLYYSSDLTHSWKSHPENPLVKRNGNTARNGGKIIINNNKLFRFAQDGIPTYGNSIRALEIVKMDEHEYEEKEIGILLKAGTGWNSRGMHQFVFDEGIASVDGIQTHIQCFGHEIRSLSKIFDWILRGANSIL